MKTQNPWMGRARGSAGNMTSSKVYDKNVMRAKAFEVNNPKTAAQTNERNFFAECQALSQTLSEEQLRTLFGVKPKSKSRRNALLTQLLSNYDFAEETKIFTFGKNSFFGNGPKVNTPVIEMGTPGETYGEDYTVEMFGSNAKATSSVFLVGINTTQKSLFVLDLDMNIERCMNGYNLSVYFDENDEVSFYPTIEVNGKALDRPAYGSFSIKTHVDK